MAAHRTQQLRWRGITTTTACTTRTKASGPGRLAQMAAHSALGEYFHTLPVEERRNHPPLPMEASCEAG
eukprot:2891185-Alexandrium_andersonii.AAC.1